MVLMRSINLFAVVSTSLVAQGNKMTAVLVYPLLAVTGFIVVMLAILLIAITTIRYRSRKRQEGNNGIITVDLHNLACTKR